MPSPLGESGVFSQHDLSVGSEANGWEGVHLKWNRCHFKANILGQTCMSWGLIAAASNADYCPSFELAVRDIVSAHSMKVSIFSAVCKAHAAEWCNCMHMWSSDTCSVTDTCMQLDMIQLPSTGFCCRVLGGHFKCCCGHLIYAQFLLNSFGVWTV